MLFKGILVVDRLINVAAKLQIQLPFFASAFSEVFFPKSCLKVECGLYTSVYSICANGILLENENFM